MSKPKAAKKTNKQLGALSLLGAFEALRAEGCDYGQALARMMKVAHFNEGALRCVADMVYSEAAK